MTLLSLSSSSLRISPSQAILSLPVDPWWIHPRWSDLVRDSVYSLAPLLSILHVDSPFATVRSRIAFVVKRSPTLLPVSRSRQRPRSRRNRKQVSSAVDSPRLSCTLSLSFDRFYTTLGLCGSRVRSRASRRGRSYWRIAERYVLDGLQSFWGGSRPSGSEIRVEISRFARGCEGVCGRRSPCQGRWRWMLFWGEHFKSPHRLLHLS